MGPHCDIAFGLQSCAVAAGAAAQSCSRRSALGLAAMVYDGAEWRAGRQVSRSYAAVETTVFGLGTVALGTTAAVLLAGSRGNLYEYDRHGLGVGLILLDLIPLVATLHGVSRLLEPDRPESRVAVAPLFGPQGRDVRLAGLSLSLRL